MARIIICLASQFLDIGSLCTLLTIKTVPLLFKYVLRHGLAELKWHLNVQVFACRMSLES